MDVSVILPRFTGFRSSSYFKSSTNSNVIIIAIKHAPFKVPHRMYIDVRDGFDAASGRNVFGQLLAPQLLE